MALLIALQLYSIAIFARMSGRGTFAVYPVAQQDQEILYAETPSSNATSTAADSPTPSDNAKNEIESEKRLTIASSQSHVIQEREVPFMTYDEMESNNRPDHYSGMWWASRESFVKKWRLRGTPAAITASFRMFIGMGASNVYMTYDWLDFCVEHLSHYWKFVRYDFDDEEGNETFRIQVEKQMNFMRERVKPYPNRKDWAFNSTLVVFAYYTGPNATSSRRIVQSDENIFDKDMSFKPYDKIRSANGRRFYLYSLAMSSTIASLWQLGTRRVTVAGNVMVEPPEVRAAFNLFLDTVPGASASSIELAYVPTFDKNTTKIHVPPYALNKLQLALNGSMTDKDERRRWLGDDPDQWRYIYYTEPDLIQHTRPESLPALSQALDDNKLLASHRFQLIPHAADYPHELKKHRRNYMPNYGNRSTFYDLDIQNELGNGYDACCDAGPQAPGREDYPPCKSWWYRCGFENARKNMTNEQIFHLHYRMHPYPNIRIVNGMQVPVFQEHGRICLPKKNGICTK